LNPGRRQIFGAGDDDVYFCVLRKSHSSRQFDFATLDDSLVGENLHRIQLITGSTRVATFIDQQGKLREPDRSDLHPVTPEVAGSSLGKFAPTRYVHFGIPQSVVSRLRTSCRLSTGQRLATVIRAIVTVATANRHDAVATFDRRLGNRLEGFGLTLDF
jgi:hypothetical protein